MESRRDDKPTLNSAISYGISSKLSLRQLNVAQLAASGYSNREIAFELKTTEQIVKNVLHSVFDKLGVWNRVELTNRVKMIAEVRIVAKSQPEFESDHPSRLRQCENSDAEAGQFLTEFNNVAESGMDLRDLLADPEFRLRKKLPRKEIFEAAEAYRSLARVFTADPDVVLKSLVEAATTFCGADSAGISLEEKDEDGQRRFRWIAISGSFAPFLGGTTPRFFSPCGTTLDIGRPQLYRVGKAYYDHLGIKADPITDGILLPWQADDVRGTIWVVSHRHSNAFDLADFKLMNGLAEFSAIAVENRFHRRTSHAQKTRSTS